MDCVGDRLYPISLISLSSSFWAPLPKKNCFSFSQKKKKKIIFNDQLMLIDFCKDHQVPNSANRNLFGTRGTLLQMQFYLKNRNVSQCKSEFSDKLKGQTGFIWGMYLLTDLWDSLLAMINRTFLIYSSFLCTQWNTARKIRRLQKLKNGTFIVSPLKK